MFSRTLDMNFARAFKLMQEDGWVTIWRQKKGRQAALYCLSNKGKILCGKIHKMCTGESEIPDTAYNKMTTSEKQIDKYYLNVIREMKNKKSPD